MKHLYVAEDGTQFENKRECLKYEGIPFIRLFAVDKELDLNEESAVADCRIAYVPYACRNEFNKLCYLEKVQEVEFDGIDECTKWIFWDETMNEWTGLNDDVVDALCLAVPIVKQ